MTVIASSVMPYWEPASLISVTHACSALEEGGKRKKIARVEHWARIHRHLRPFQIDLLFCKKFGLVVGVDSM